MIQTTTMNHRQEIETQEIETNIRQKSEPQKSLANQKKNVNGTIGKIEISGTGSIKFKSVLTKPFALWNEVEDIVGEFLTYLNSGQRRKVIKNLIRFLELKVIMEEYSSSGLLSPTEAVAHVWHVLILETELYRDVVYTIQDYHARPHRFIHHALFRKYNTKEYHERLERTQRLFKSYYGAEMPTVLRMETHKLGDTIAKDLPTSVTMNAPSSVSESFDEYTFDNKKPFPTWYPLWLPSCSCFGSQNDYDDFYAEQENVSLLSTPHGL